MHFNPQFPLRQGPPTILVCYCEKQIDVSFFLSVFVLVMIFVITLSKSLVLHVNPSDIIMCRRVSLVQYTIGHTIIGLHEVVIVKVAVNPLSSTRSRLVAENNLK